MMRPVPGPKRRRFGGLAACLLLVALLDVQLQWFHIPPLAIAVRWWPPRRRLHAVQNPPVTPPRFVARVPLLPLESGLADVPVILDAFVATYATPPLANSTCVVLVSRRNPNAAPNETKINASAITIRVGGAETSRTATFSMKHCRMHCSNGRGGDNSGRNNNSSWTFTSAFCGLSAVVDSGRGGSAASTLHVEVVYEHAGPPAHAYVREIEVPVLRAPAEARRHPSIAMMTQFLHEPDLLLPWIQHYARLGVDTFYLYYNAGVYGADGELVPALRTQGIAEVLALPGVQLVEWLPPFFDEWGVRQSQVPALQSWWHRYRQRHDWMMHFDMDEFLLLPRGERLHSVLAAQPADCAVLLFPSAFAWLNCSGALQRGGGNEARFPRHLSALHECGVLRVPRALTHKRQKMAVSTAASIEAINIHAAASRNATERTCSVDPSVGTFLHFVNLWVGDLPSPHGSVDADEVAFIRSAANETLQEWHTPGVSAVAPRVAE